VVDTWLHTTFRELAPPPYSGNWLSLYWQISSITVVVIVAFIVCFCNILVHIQ